MFFRLPVILYRQSTLRNRFTTGVYIAFKASSVETTNKKYDSQSRLVYSTTSENKPGKLKPSDIKSSSGE